jgi:hypothetical protein
MPWNLAERSARFLASRQARDSWKQVRMLVLVWRFVTLMLASLAAGLTFGHLLRMPARLGLDGASWLTATRDAGGFGMAGATLEVAALLAAVLLVALVRGRGAPFVWSALAVGLLLAAQVVWWLLVAPAGTEIAVWRPDALPADWQGWRDRWEQAQAARALLQTAALASLFLSVLLDARPDPLAMSAHTAARRLGVRPR